MPTITLIPDDKSQPEKLLYSAATSATQQQAIASEATANKKQEEKKQQNEAIATANITQFIAKIRTDLKTAQTLQLELADGQIVPNTQEWNAIGPKLKADQEKAAPLWRTVLYPLRIANDAHDNKPANSQLKIAYDTNGNPLGVTIVLPALNEASSSQDEVKLLAGSLKSAAVVFQGSPAHMTFGESFLHRIQKLNAQELAFIFKDLPETIKAKNLPNTQELMSRFNFSQDQIDVLRAKLAPQETPKEEESTAITLQRG